MNVAEDENFPAALRPASPLADENPRPTGGWTGADLHFDLHRP